MQKQILFFSKALKTFPRQPFIHGVKTQKKSRFKTKKRRNSSNVFSKTTRLKAKKFQPSPPKNPAKQKKDGLPPNPAENRRPLNPSRTRHPRSAEQPNPFGDLVVSKQKHNTAICPPQRKNTASQSLADTMSALSRATKPQKDLVVSKQKHDRAIRIIQRKTVILSTTRGHDVRAQRSNQIPKRDLVVSKEIQEVFPYGFTVVLYAVVIFPSAFFTNSIITADFTGFRFSSKVI